jgi:RHS repeat-associated protein
VESKKNANSGYWQYAGGLAYAPSGAVTSLRLGNGRWESTQFNSRLQPTQIALGSTQNSTDLLKINYSYGTTANNGNVLSQQITVPTAGSSPGFVASQAYSYDALNRLSEASEIVSGSQTWKQSFVFDRYGNRRFDTTQNRTTTLAPNCPAAVCNPEANAANNRLIGTTFDSAGNTTVNADSQQYVYDGENKMVAAKDASGNLVGQYWYDGDGKRVKKYVPGTGETTIFVYDASGKTVAEYSTVISDTPQVAYLTADNLGTPRINTNAGGAVIARHDYHPFGEEIAGVGGRTQGLGYASDEVRKQFTGYERDQETDLDFAQARMYVKQIGRFTTVDPLISSGRIENPQTWSRYNYVLGNPLMYTDPLGLYEWDASAGGGTSDEALQSNSTDKSLSKKDRNRARKALRFRQRFREGRAIAIKAASNPKLTDEQRTRILAAVGAYGEENDHNGVFVAVASSLGTGTGASTQLREDGTTLVKFKPSDQGDSLAISIAHEGQHVADIDTYLSSREENGSTDLPHYERERKAYEITSFVAQGLGKSSAINGFGPKYQVWNSGWKAADVAEKRAKAINLMISTYYSYDANTNPGNKYSQEFEPYK